MNNELQYWNEIFLNCGENKPVYDDWLIKHNTILEESKSIPVIDLGCGSGCDTLFLYEKGYKVVSCDFCNAALERVKKFVPEYSVKLFNMLDGLPFEVDSAVVLIADLSIHYFSKKDTFYILREIRRVLKPDGYFICRVNSVNDINYGAGKGIVIEKNYFDNKGKKKRFFDQEDINIFFDGWKLEYLKESEMNRYGDTKIVWEIVAKNIGIG